MSIQGLDKEWLELIKQAKAAGMTKEEVRQFLLGKKEGKDLQPEALKKVN
ncbi:MAG: anti-repressor SinI family protein [Bacillus sp. (in: firmicutes)]